MKVIDLPEVEQDSELKTLMLNWVDWCRSRDNNGLRYPSQVPYVRLMKPTSSSKVKTNEKDAWLIEKAVIRLPERERTLIRIHYFLRHLPIHTRVREVARRGYSVQERRYFQLKNIAESMIKNILTRLQ